MRTFLSALVLLALPISALSGPAYAADKPAAKPGDASGKGPVGTNVEMPYVMAPMTGADGKLAGYAYIATLLTATSDTNALAVRDKLAFVQDAMVRDVNGVTIAKPGDPTSVDQAALITRLTADATKVMGAGKVRNLAIVTIQLAPLHPTRTEVPAADAPDMDVPPPADSPAKPAAKPAEKPKAGG